MHYFKYLGFMLFIIFALVFTLMTAHVINIYCPVLKGVSLPFIALLYAMLFRIFILKRT